MVCSRGCASGRSDGEIFIWVVGWVCGRVCVVIEFEKEMWMGEHDGSFIGW